MDKKRDFGGNIVLYLRGPPKDDPSKDHTSNFLLNLEKDDLKSTFYQHLNYRN